MELVSEVRAVAQTSRDDGSWIDVELQQWGGGRSEAARAEEYS